MSPELSFQHLEVTTPNRLESTNRRQAIARLGGASQEAKTRDLLRTRFTKGSIEEIADYFRGLIEEAKEKNSNMGTYELFRTVVDELPQRIPFEAQQKALQAFASIDTNTRRFGQEAFLLLNMKTLFTRPVVK